MNHRATPRVKLAALLAVAASFRAFPVQGADERGAPPGLQVRTEAPAPRLRSVSPDEAAKAREELRRARQTQSGAASEQSPTGAASSAPSRANGANASALLSPTPLPLPSPAAAKTPVLGPIPRLKRQGAPSPYAPPPWKPDWTHKRLGAARQGDFAEAAFEYEWQGLYASIRLVPLEAAQEPICVLLKGRDTEVLCVRPGTYRIEIEGWRPADPAPTALYRFEAKEFDRSYRETLRFEPSLAENLLTYIERVDESRRGGKPRGVELDVKGTERGRSGEGGRADSAGRL